MNSKYFKSLPAFASTNINVDRENGIIKKTCIANFGDNKNGSYFDETFLNDLMNAGNKSEGGIKSRFNHPNICSGSFGTYIGRYRNFEIENNKLYADLYLDPITKTLEVEGKGMKMFDYITTMAENNPDMFGNSIHIYSQEYEKPVDGELKIHHHLKTFKACDLVDDPAATDSLFSSNPNDLGVITTQFLDENPSIFEALEKNPNIIQDFFERYFNYANRKSLNTFNMSKPDFFKKLFGKKPENKFDIDVTLADGSIVTVKTDAEQPKEGDEVVDDTGEPVGDDTHLLPDGGSIETVDGKITKINPAPAGDPPADPPAEPTMQEVMNSVAELGRKFETFSKKLENSVEGTDESLKLVAQELKTFQTETKKKFENIKSSYDVPPATPPAPRGSGEGRKGYDPDAAKEFREKKDK
ncbi:hypothetical protein [Flavobacterium sedimenticola]|uniref:Uncharacterized protein n=1 Tax=Flavobacterium sedimenticola TaxID=3043286 RepID=A0ABT6XNB1_9FLAO|nr:hypothetical protein [Flavobacterium sedimenticola]MDI9256322.1 hypothetical protein [Flavobacterium sedimenticola]